MVTKYNATHIKPGSTVHLSMDDYVIEGDIPDGTNITCDGNLGVTGKVGSHVTINIGGYFSTTHPIGNGTSIVAENIYVNNVGNSCTLHAFKGDIRAKEIGSLATLTALGKIEFDHALDNLRAKAEGGIYFIRTGEYATMKAASIAGLHHKTGSVGDSSMLVSTADDIDLQDVGHHSTVFAAGKVTIAGTRGDRVTVGRFTEQQDEKRMLHNGCGIYFDKQQDRYLIPDALQTNYGKAAYSELMEQLCINPRIQSGVEACAWVDEKGELGQGHWIKLSGGHASKQAIRSTITDFVEKHREASR